MKPRPLRVLVVEDEPRNLDLLKRRLERLGAVVVGEAADSESAWQQIETLQAAEGLDAVFMDIWLEYETAGIDVGRRLRDLPNRPRLVFISSHPEFQKYLWPCHPDYFVEKPVLGSELEQALARVRYELGKPPSPQPPPLPAQALLIKVKSKGQIWVIASDSISHCGAGVVHFEDKAGKPQRLEGKIQVAGRLSERLEDWEALLAPHGFFRTHTSHLVNLARVQYLKPADDGHALKLWGRNELLPVARNKWKPLLAALECKHGAAAGQDPLLERWARAWRALKLVPPEGLAEDLLVRYGESHRQYHSLQHLRECLDWLDLAHAQCEQPAEVELALWFHDAIHEPGRPDNEERSAAWAEEALRKVGASPDCAGRVRDLVLATRHVGTPKTPDQAVLVDIDLAILGAEAERFDQYEAQIREEFREFPLDRFRAARHTLLARWLAAPSLYHTDFFRKRLEKTARENLRRVLAGPG